MESKTLIGLEDYLFLNNDSNKELEVHLNNLNLVNENNLTKYDFDNFLLIVIPNKSLVYKDKLPFYVEKIYRPAFELYKNKLNNKLLDIYDCIISQNEKDVFYKTDSHMNFKGGYFIYKNFINKINELYHLNIIPKDITISCNQIELSNSGRAIGDLLWGTNLGNQIVNNKIDNFYFSIDINDLYNIYKIINTSDIRLLDYNLIDKTLHLENLDTLFSWPCLSEYIIYKKNNEIEKKLKILIFYDSFLVNSLSLYLDLFYEIFLVKNIYEISLIQLINPDFVFEFRVERFLN